VWGDSSLTVLNGEHIVWGDTSPSVNDLHIVWGDLKQVTGPVSLGTWSPGEPDLPYTTGDAR
jgi:hypothetical protein